MGDTKKPRKSNFPSAPWGGVVLGSFGGLMAVGVSEPELTVIAMVIGALLCSAFQALCEKVAN